MLIFLTLDLLIFELSAEVSQLTNYHLSLVCGKGRLLLRLSKLEKDIFRRNLGNRMSLRSTRVVIRVNPRQLYIIIYQQRAKKPGINYVRLFPISD